MRNPWQHSFDGTTGDVYIADVGQEQWEKANNRVADESWVWQNTIVFQPSPSLTSFREDEAGEVYIVDRGGVVFLPDKRP